MNVYSYLEKDKEERTKSCKKMKEEVHQGHFVWRTQEAWREKDRNER